VRPRNDRPAVRPAHPAHRAALHYRASGAARRQHRGVRRRAPGDHRGLRRRPRRPEDLLSGWWRIATRAAADPADRQRMHQEAGQLQSGAPRQARPWPRCWADAGSTCWCTPSAWAAPSPKPRSTTCPMPRSTSYEVLQLTPGNVGILRQSGNTYVWDYKGISVTYVLVDPLARGRGAPGRPCPSLKAPALAHEHGSRDCSRFAGP
jgi:hypothetical protein